MPSLASSTVALIPAYLEENIIDKNVLRQKMLDACQFMLENQTPIWVGEFGPVYTGYPAEDAMRYQLLEDQISIYQELGASWTLMDV